MAFKPTAVPASTDEDVSWKAQGFINISLPSKDGKSNRKLGAIPLRDSNVNEKSLREFLEADPANLDKVLSKLILNYQNASPAEDSGFDLS